MKCETRKGIWHCNKEATRTMNLGYVVKSTKKKESAELHLCAEHYLEVKNIVTPN